MMDKCSDSFRREANPNGLIGVFDSGIGGLSVARAIRVRLPDEPLLYVADSINCPYGARPVAEIRRLSEGISRYLIDRGAKIVVVACNTASAAALAHLRTVFPHTPIVGMVPAVKPAAQITQSGVVGVLATPTTLEAQLYRDVVEHHGTGTRVIARACPGLVECVEAGDIDSAETEKALWSCVEPLLSAGADVLVIGCTHYPFLIPALRRLVGETITIMEPSEAIARQTANVLEREGLLRKASSSPVTVYATTGNVTRFCQALERLAGHLGAVESLRWAADTLVGQQ